MTVVRFDDASETCLADGLGPDPLEQLTRKRPTQCYGRGDATIQISRIED